MEKVYTKKMDTKKMDTKKCVYEKKICVYIYNVYICVVIHSNKRRTYTGIRW